MPIKTNKAEKDVYGQSDMSSPNGQTSDTGATRSSDSAGTTGATTVPTTGGDVVATSPKPACRQHVDEALGGGHGH